MLRTGAARRWCSFDLEGHMGGPTGGKDGEAMMTAIVRWDRFLARIAERHGVMRAGTEAAARTFIAGLAPDGDYQPLSQQLTAVGHRLQELEGAITSTWHAKVDAAILADGHGGVQRDWQFTKGLALLHALEDAREELEPRIFAELARDRFARALRSHRSTACAACGAMLAINTGVRAVEVSCHCGARNLVPANALVRTVAAIGTHAIAQEAVVLEWRVMRAAERAVHALAPPRPLAPLKAYERAQLAYWFSYLAVRARFEPELARDPAAEVRARMESWYTSVAEHEQAWVTAGRPRERI